MRKSRRSTEPMSMNNVLKKFYENCQFYLQFLYTIFLQYIWYLFAFVIEPKYQQKVNEPFRHRLERMSANNSAEESHSRRKISNKTRVTVRSISNQNINRAESSPVPSTKISNVFGSLDSHIVVTPVSKPSEKVSNREELSDALCRRLQEPLTWMTRPLCCVFHSRRCYCPTLPLDQSSKSLALPLPVAQEKTTPSIKELTQSSSSSYSVSPSIQSHQTESAENDLNQSIFSFPDHETSPSERSDRLVNYENQLRLDAQNLVDDSIRLAQEKYQQIMRMSIDHDIPNKALNPDKSTTKTKTKSVLIVDQSDQTNFCEELCEKLNLSNAENVKEILRVLASNAPHFLKEDSSSFHSAKDQSNAVQENQPDCPPQLLLHPPFQPKRLIYLAPNGAIQVLSAVDDQSDETPMIPPSKYRLNYSNSALKSSYQSNESSLAMEYETTTTLNLKTHFNPMICTDLPLTQTLDFDHSSLDGRSTEHQISMLENPEELPPSLVRLNLNFKDSFGNGDSDDEENSLPIISFKRVVVLEEPKIISKNGNRRCSRSHRPMARP